MATLINHQIIIAPVITEKSLAQTALNQYTFKVSPRANKHQIKQAIETLFSVDVVNIRTIKSNPRKEKPARTNKYRLIRSNKKAIVELKPKQKIDLFDIKNK